MATIMKQYANLHMHSTYSDGRYTPEELASLAKEIGYGAIALTDHDTVTGNTRMKKACEEWGLDWIFGVEFCSKFETTGHVMHLAAFDFDPEHPYIKEHIYRMSERYGGLTRDLFHRGVSNGEIKGISWEEVEELNPEIRWFTVKHVISAMKAKGLVTEEDITRIRENCFSRELKLATPKRYGFPPIEEFIPAVHDAGGIILVAHPHQRLEDVRELVRLGIDGLEVWHGELPAWERREALRLARDLDLYVSGGDDHMGLLGGNYVMTDEPPKNKYYFPPQTLGTTKYFFEEIRDKKKGTDRKEVMDELLSRDELWEKTGGIIDDAES